MCLVRHSISEPFRIIWRGCRIVIGEFNLTGFVSHLSDHNGYVLSLLKSVTGGDQLCLARGLGNEVLSVGPPLNQVASQVL